MPNTEIIVTPDIARVGMRVCRGRDWAWLNQDGNRSGTIKKIHTTLDLKGWCEVRWDGGMQNTYRIGGMTYGDTEPKFDLYIFLEPSLVVNSPVKTKINLKAFRHAINKHNRR